MLLYDPWRCRSVPYRIRLCLAFGDLKRRPQRLHFIVDQGVVFGFSDSTVSDRGQIDRQGGKRSGRGLRQPSTIPPLLR